MENKDNNYKVAFFTLLGIIVGALITICIFLFIGKDKKNQVNNDKSNLVEKNNIYENANESKLEEETPSSNEIKEDSTDVNKNDIKVESKSNSNKNNTNISTSNKEKTSSTTVSNNKNTTSSEKDSKVINYLKDKKASISSSVTKENAKKVFTDTVDFLFYDGKIKGYTFNELTDKGKMEVTKLATEIEIKIEQKFPGAIDETKNKYSALKEKVLDKYHTTVENYCSKSELVCDEFRDGYENMKSSFKNTFNIIKEIGSKGKDKLSNWYSNFKNN